MDEKPKVYKLGVTKNDRSEPEEVKEKASNYLVSNRQEQEPAEDLDEGTEAEEGPVGWVVEVPGLFRTRRNIFAEKAELRVHELRFYSQNTLISAFSKGSWKAFFPQELNNLK